MSSGRERSSRRSTTPARRIRLQSPTFADRQSILRSLRVSPSRMVIPVRSKSSRIWIGNELASAANTLPEDRGGDLAVAAPFGEKLRNNRRFDNDLVGIGMVVAT